MTELLTGLLVAITAYYAWQNRRMVQEMRSARGVQVTPKLVPTLRLVGAGHCFPRIVNAGPGPAVAVSVVLALSPDGPSRKWASAVVAPGEAHDFLIEEEGVDLVKADSLTERYSRLTLNGSCVNALGNTVTIDETVDIREVWSLIKSANELQPSEGPIEIQLKNVVKELHGIAAKLK